MAFQQQLQQQRLAQQAQPRVVISDQQMLSVVRNKEHFYQGMLRNGYFLPSYRSTIVTLEYMRKVRSGELYVPKYIDIRLRPCPEPPTKTTLLAMVIFTLQQKGLRPMGGEIKKGRVPNQEWLLAVLSTLDSGNAIFKKSYTPPPIVSKRGYQKVEIIDTDTFYEGLPALHKKRDLKASGKSLMPKKVKLQVPAPEGAPLTYKEQLELTQQLVMEEVQAMNQAKESAVASHHAIQAQNLSAQVQNTSFQLLSASLNDNHNRIVKPFDGFRESVAQPSSVPLQIPNSNPNSNPSPSVPFRAPNQANSQHIPSSHHSGQNSDGELHSLNLEEIAQHQAKQHALVLKQQAQSQSLLTSQSLGGLGRRTQQIPPQSLTSAQLRHSKGSINTGPRAAKKKQNESMSSRDSA